MPSIVYTIGHSNHSIEKLLHLLVEHPITALADVRSHPYSRFNPQFNRENLHKDLEHAGISYIFLGNELGARPVDRTCYVEGTVQYDRLASTKLFQQGIQRIVKEAETEGIVLLCAEKDPLTCHRSILISRHLSLYDNISIQHILEDGRLEDHQKALIRLLKELHLPEEDLFRTRDDFILEAYEQRGRQIAYTEIDRFSEKASLLDVLREVKK